MLNDAERERLKKIEQQREELWNDFQKEVLCFCGGTITGHWNQCPGFEKPDNLRFMQLDKMLTHGLLIRRSKSPQNQSV